MNSVQVILLAGGKSTRFGSDKRFALWQGRSLWQQSAAKYLNAGLPVSLVHGLNQAELFVRDCEGALPTGLSLVHCVTATEGMAETLKSGVRAHPEADYLMVALADMPSVRSATIVTLCECVSEGKKNGDAKIIVPEHKGRLGHPRLFHRSLQSELLDLQGDQGARALLNQYEVTKVPVEDPGILFDVDRRSDIIDPHRCT